MKNLVLLVFLLHSVFQAWTFRYIRPVTLRPNYRATRKTQTCITGCSCKSRYYRRYWDIDCSGMGMTSIPKVDLSYNTYLNLRGNNITEIKHEDFDRLQNLYKLDLRDNPIKNIPSGVFFKLRRLRELMITADSFHHFAFHGLTSLIILRIEGSSSLTNVDVVLMKPLIDTLQNLTITKTNIIEIDDHVFAGMKNLRYLDLSENSIASISDHALKGSSKLTKIWLRGNKLTSFPKALRDHLSLTQIDVQSNLISSIAIESFNKMYQLRTLDLSNNQIKEIDDDLFKSAPLLNTVKMSHNQLTKLPNALIPNKCDSLNYLYLDNNIITQLNTNGKKKCPIRILSLAGNPLVSLNITGMNTLNRLDISKNCKLENFTIDKRINYYDLSENCLEKLPSYFEKTYTSIYSTVNTLNLYGNRFENFSVKFTITNLNLSMNGLKSIKVKPRTYVTHGKYDLSYNKLKSIEIEGRRFRISYLYLRNNSIKTLDLSKYSNLNKLDLSNNQIAEFDSSQYSTYSSYSYLNTIWLKGNQLTNIKEGTFSKFNYLYHLDLAQNQINKIARSAFRNNNMLRTLNISSNKLINISAEISSLSSLEILDISSNLLTSIDENTLVNMKRLKRISLSHNKLQKIPTQFSKFVQTYLTSVTVDLSNNDLQCSCNITIMLSYYGNLKPLGTCTTKKEVVKQLSEFVMPFEDLSTKSKCNLCPLSPCNYKGICSSDKKSGFTCQCYRGYSGKLCQEPVVDCFDPRNCTLCSDTSCKNGGTCFENEEKKSFSCSCTPGYTGDTCDQAICVPNPCLNGGTCRNNTSNKDLYQCDCLLGYGGANCQYDYGQCDPEYCNNHGVCSSEANSKKCFCNPGYYGSNCEMEISALIKSNIKPTKSNVSSYRTAVIVLVLLLLIVIAIISVFISQKYGYCGSGRRSKDQMELVNDFD